MKKTKIIGTIGPASRDIEILRELVKNGMDVARLNMKYADYDFCKDVIKKIEDINADLDANVAIMLDLKGADITVGNFTGGSAYLNRGDKIRIYMEELVGDSTKFSVSYPGLINDVKTNNIIKLNDGLIELVVLEKGPNYLMCEVSNGGFIENGKGVNVPDVKLNMPFLTDKDKQDIRFANEHHIDFLALSFISNSEHVLEVNDLLIELGNDHIGLISKIENEAAVDDIDEIIRVSEGVLLARGDLGVEIPMERIPGIQKAIISKCHVAGKISVIATEMLASMEHSIRPTRAEVSDVANAVLDGTDAVMLSGETTIGKYPVSTLATMAKIIESAEEDINYFELLDRAMRTERQDTTGSIAYSVVECANRLKCKAIVAPTMSGYTARKTSRFRPSCPILAISPNVDTVKSLALYFGVYPILIDDIRSFDKIMEKGRDLAKEYLNTEKRDRIIITGGYPFHEVKHTNFMKIEEL